MPSELKRMMSEELAARYTVGTDYIVVGYTKMSGQETATLRKKMREQGLRLEVVKNRIAARTLAANEIGSGARFLTGPSALVMGEVETPTLCKLVTGYAKEYRDKFTIRGGVMDGEMLEAETVEDLADIPPMPVLHAMIAGSFQAPVVAVAAAFQSLPRSLACALEGIRKQKE